MTSALDYMGNAVKASARSKAAEVLAKVAGADTITHVWGYDPNVQNTEHHSGLAVDFMVFNDKPLGDRIYEYLWANRDRLGVQHIIWQQSITSTRVSPGVRRHMADRGSTTANHLDHVHVLFFDRAYVAPTTAPAPTKPATTTSYKVLRRGVKSNAVRSLQNALNRVFSAYSHLATDGDFGPATEAVIREFQFRAGLPVDGIVGPATRAKLASMGAHF